jgi:HK97 family phage prohead protease
MTMEHKTIALTEVELKFGEDAWTIEGYASVFNGVDSYGDMILPGAYTETLANRERAVQMRWNHKGPIIGKWIEIEQDAKGLRVKGELTKGHSAASDVYALLKHGAINGLSIGYRIPSGGSEKDGRLRKLRKIDLVEVSVVEEPADVSARVMGVKCDPDELQDLKSCEAFLRDACGLSRADATSLVGRIKRLTLGEQESEAKAAAELSALFDQMQIPTIQTNEVMK